MTKLMYGNRKSDAVTWDISSPTQRRAAFLDLFRLLRDVWKVYESDYWGEADEERTQKKLYKQACAGDSAAAEALLAMRRDYEYEEWQIIEAKDRKAPSS